MCVYGGARRKQRYKAQYDVRAAIAEFWMNPKPMMTAETERMETAVETETTAFSPPAAGTRKRRFDIAFRSPSKLSTISSLDATQTTDGSRMKGTYFIDEALTATGRLCKRLDCCIDHLPERSSKKAQCQ